MNFLVYLEDSALSEWLSVSMLGFPTLIALHSVGMAVTVGLSLIITLRLFQLIGFSEPLLPRLLAVAAWGFVLNLVTGLAIFITRGSEYITSAVFLIKMLLVVVGTAVLFSLLRYVGGSASTSTSEAGTSAGGRAARNLSLVATVAFFAAVVAGRQIAYLSDLYR